jgi:FixJ family two-component response regulator
MFQADLSNEIPIVAVVDDDDSIRRAMERLVRSLGYSASTFASADEFLKSELVGSTSCLITDLHMPGLSGLDLQDRLIARGHRISVIFITADPNEIARTRAVKAGAIGFFNKPINHHHFINCLNEALKPAWQQECRTIR